MAQTLSTLELEKRMRPGRWSEGGFLGPSEALEQVIAQDGRTLAQFGVTTRQIADALMTILPPALEYSGRNSPYPDLYRPGTIPHFGLDNLPDSQEGYRVENLQLFTRGYRGFQECPWGCEHRGDLLDSCDFLILNRESGEFVTGPGLIIHLIREHQFFEGTESPYRTDPARLIRILGLDRKP